MADRFGESDNVLIESLKENAKTLKHTTKFKQLTKSVEVLGSTEGTEGR